MIKRLLDRFFPRYRRLEARPMLYAEANQLLASGQGWRIATKEEDWNVLKGIVWLERVELDPRVRAKERS